MKHKFRKIWYVSLEPQKQRYSWNLSFPLVGWQESNWIENYIPYERIEGHQLGDGEIKTGVALDGAGRGYYACSQIMELLHRLDNNEVDAEDVIYFEDFWHPGIEALPYYFHLANTHPKMYANCWAQSVDMYDFTFPMRSWMRHYEKGNGAILDGVFVTSSLLKELLVRSGISNKVYVIGHPFRSESIIKKIQPYLKLPREDKVVWSSRWDWEKRPSVFLRLVKRMPHIQFVICTSAPKLRSNSGGLLEQLATYLTECPNLTLKDNLTKDEYYKELCTAKVQFNSALQDWVSYTLLESVTCGCFPVYPRFRSFPEVFDSADMGYLLYEDDDVSDASHIVQRCIDEYSTAVADFHFDSMIPRFDRSWERMIHIMNGEDYETLYSRQDSV